MDDSKWERYAALGGIMFVVLAVIASLIGGTPPARDDEPVEIVNYYIDNDSALQAGAFLAGLGVIGILWWFGSLWRAMVRAEDGSPRLAIVAFGGLLFAGAMAFAGWSVNAATAIGIEAVGGGASYFYNLATILFSMASFGNAVLVGAVSGLIWRTGFMARWLGQAGSVLSVAWLVAGLGVATDAAAINVVGFIVFLAWALWIVLVSLELWQAEPADA